MKQTISDHYEIYYDRRNIIVYSLGRLTFEPKGWQIDLKRDLRNAVEQLRANGSEGVLGVYGTDHDSGFVDTENALFYNIGTASFHNIAQHSVAFDTLSPDETNRLFAQAGKSRYHHYYSYHVSSFCHRTLNPLVSWNKVTSFSLRGNHKPLDYWKLLREHVDNITVFDGNDFTKEFGIELRFYEPDTKPINLANPMKALLDGIICAFHRMPDSTDMEQIMEVSSRLNIPAEQFLYKEKTILGEEIYVRPYRDNVSWNPQDHRCSSVSMSIEYGAAQRCFSGQFYRIGSKKNSAENERI